MALEQQDKELVAIGASIGASCRPCIEHHIPAGRDVHDLCAYDAEDLSGALDRLIIRAQPACRRPTAAFSIVGSSSSTAFAAGPSGMKLSSLVTRVIRPA
jgi:hypothetical protein